MYLIIHVCIHVFFHVLVHSWIPSFIPHCISSFIGVLSRSPISSIVSSTSATEWHWYKHVYFFILNITFYNELAMCTATLVLF